MSRKYFLDIKLFLSFRNIFFLQQEFFSYQKKKVLVSRKKNSAKKQDCFVTICQAFSWHQKTFLWVLLFITLSSKLAKNTFSNCFLCIKKTGVELLSSETINPLAQRWRLKTENKKIYFRGSFQFSIVTIQKISPPWKPEI